MTRVALYTRVSTDGRKPRTSDGSFAPSSMVTRAGSWSRNIEMRNRVPPGAALDSKRSSRTPTSGSSRSSSSGRTTASRATINYLHELESYGVGFVSYTERYLDSTGIFRDALIGLLVALANQEGIRLSDRVKAGMARARIEGKHVGRPRLDDRTRRQVRELRAQNPDMSIRAIARETEVPTLPPGDCSLSARSHQEAERGLGLACVFVPLFLDPRLSLDQPLLPRAAS